MLHASLVYFVTNSFPNTFSRAISCFIQARRTESRFRDCSLRILARDVEKIWFKTNDFDFNIYLHISRLFSRNCMHISEFSLHISDFLRIFCIALLMNVDSIPSTPSQQPSPDSDALSQPVFELIDKHTHEPQPGPTPQKKKSTDPSPPSMRPKYADPNEAENPSVGTTIS